MEIIAIIPARGGSKSIPKKNIVNLEGHPLIAYSIACGLAARTINRVIISTDDPEIAEIATQFGAEVPFLRPIELAKDDTPDLPVFQHAIEWLELEENYYPDIVVQLRPTSPLRPKGLIDEAVGLFTQNPGIDCVRGVVEAEENPFKMWLIDPTGFMKPLMEGQFDEPYNMPRQKLPETFWQTGHIDVIGIKTIKDQKSLTGTKILPIFIDRKYCIDIDTLDHISVAERLLSSGKLDIHWPRSEDLPTTSSSDYKEVLPKKIELIILDFDGVMTDNKVIVLEDGSEGVVCNRSDGLAIDMLRRANFNVIVLSQEANPVVEKRCLKLSLNCYSGEVNKAERLVKIVKNLEISLDNCMYVGNDVNDLECMKMVGCPVAVADATEEVKSISKIVLRTKGGHGVVRELATLLLSKDETDESKEERHGQSSE